MGNYCSSKYAADVAERINSNNRIVVSKNKNIEKKIQRSTSKEVREILEKREKMLGPKPDQSFMKREFAQCDKNSDGKLARKEIDALLKKLEVNVPESIIKKKIKEYDINGDKHVDCREFVSFCKSVNRQQITNILRIAIF